MLDYFGLKTLERAYLLRINDKIVERPQHMWMRVALSIHYNNIDLVWAIKNNTKSENIFPKFLNKSLNFASWSSDEKIFKILQNGLLDSQGIDSDIDSNLYIE